MADPLLTSLCTICHIQSPKYKCPRCATRTCSLQCIKKHKKWSSCSGERDPTVYLPPTKLKTDAGIDHDYNFLTKIERSIETADKIMREERDIVPPGGQQQHKEQGGRQQHRDNHHPNKRARFNDGRHGGHDEQVVGNYSRRWDKNSQFRLRKLGIHVSTVPYGMTRSRENKTSWNKRTRTMNWQVEWFVHGNAVAEADRSTSEATSKDACASYPTRILHKILDETPLAEGFEAGLAWSRHAQLTEEERALEKSTKKKDEQQPQQSKTLTKTNPKDQQHRVACGQNFSSAAWAAHLATTQSSTTSAWYAAPPDLSPSTANKPIESDYQFFYQKPRIPSRQTQKLIPLSPADTLARILPGFEIVEFPAIHVFPKGASLPQGYALDEPQKQRGMPVRPRPNTTTPDHNGKRKAEGLVGYVSSDEDSDEADAEQARADGEAAEEDAADTTSSAESSSEEEGDEESDLDMAGA
ncbi:hypothetical protein Micbo1qcDRAFT_168243 [Microdochium bolleyi]|uniref:Box C/D snoRNA protein 1 n=1 Tax=Microdochium bolleyi TaxID=196109 RepID=A0A136IPA6_9PEZI|nr:hypothetical protein Micbo1qcDRAFT_168243 [Microdochium bolleyi]